jgi:NifU-like protein involved in Fe-S cluster formation
MWEYSEKVIDHYLYPPNVGEVAEPDSAGHFCGPRRMKSHG